VSPKEKHALLTALLATKYLVKLVEDDRCQEKLKPSDVITRMLRGHEYTWSGSSKRVRCIRPLEAQPHAPWQQCYRTAEAAILPPSAEWFQAIR
jgi:hypothetical protein